MIVAEEMSYYQCLRTEVPKLFHRNHLQCKSIRARCLLHVRGPVHHRRKYTSSHLRASVQRVRKTQCLKGPPPHVVHYLRKHALPPFCMYYNPPPVTTKRMHKTSMKHAEHLHTSRASTRGKSEHPPHPHRQAHTTEHAGLNELTNAGVTVDGERPALVPWRPEVRATLWQPTRHQAACIRYHDNMI